MKKYFTATAFAALMVIPLMGCRDFLSEKSDSRLSIPDQLEDNQAIVDRYFLLGQYPNSAEISADDIWVSDADFNTFPNESEKRLYTWKPDYVSLAVSSDWQTTYSKINIYNNVLFNLEHYQIPQAENVRGQALVLRAAAYLEAAQIWCLAYNPATAAKDLGLPIRLDPDMNIPSFRSSVEQTYRQILSDLLTAAELLPNDQIAVSRPSKRTALGLLARTYLFMGEYQKAAQYASAALAIKNELLNFNALNPGSTNPFLPIHTEIIFPLSRVNSPFLAATKAKIPQSIYDSYENNDLRKQMYFRLDASQNVLFKGNFSGGTARSASLATDELYLTAAEGHAASGNYTEAMVFLNALLINRWKTGTFIPFTATDAQSALQIIRKERRKEMLFRGVRWADLKRYNREGAGITLSRIVNGTTFVLPPNDLRYAVALPEDIIQMTGMPQNPR